MSEAEGLKRVRAAAAASGREIEIRLFDEHTSTAQAAAEALGVQLGEIAKSIVLLAEGHLILAIAAGDQRVDRQKVKALMGGVKVSIASAEEVLTATGMAAGGVSPIGLVSPATILLDQSLQRFHAVWAGAGAPQAVLRLIVADLPEVTGGRFADICV